MNVLGLHEEKIQKKNTFTNHKPSAFCHKANLQMQFVCGTLATQFVCFLV